MRNGLLELLAHEKTRHLMGRISQGDDPRRAVAELAGQTLAEKVSQLLGAQAQPRHVVGTAKVVQTAANTASDITDAEFVVIDVSPGVKKRPGKEK